MNQFEGKVLTPEGELRISSDGDDRRIFWGLKFSIPGLFWEGKFGKYFFGWLDLSRDFWGIQNNLKIRGSARLSRPRSSAWIFWGSIFGPGIFLGFVGSPRDFFWILIFAPIRSSP